jgi:hypothetical protein
MYREVDIHKAFRSPVRGTFIGASTLIALMVFLLTSAYVQNNYDGPNWKITSSLYTNTSGLALSIFTPIVIGITTSFFIKYFILIRKLLVHNKIACYLSFTGLFIAYLGVSFICVSAVLYFA